MSNDSNNEPVETIRVTVTVSAEVMAAWNLMAATHKVSRTEMLRLMISLCHTVNEAERRGDQLALLDRDGDQRVILNPFGGVR